MDRQYVLGLLDVIAGPDRESALKAAKDLRDAIQRDGDFTLGFAYSCLNSIDSLAGKWGAASPQILLVSVNTMREQLGASAR